MRKLSGIFLLILSGIFGCADGSVVHRPDTDAGALDTSSEESEPDVKDESEPDDSNDVSDTQIDNSVADKMIDVDVRDQLSEQTDVALDPLIDLIVDPIIDPTVDPRLDPILDPVIDQTPSGEWLRVEGNKILLPNGSRFHGRGANIFDTRQCGACPWASPRVDEVIRRIDELVDVWHANFMRFDLTSFASDEWDGTHLEQWGNVLVDPNYLKDLQAVAAHVTTKSGVYIMITLFDDPSLNPDTGINTDASLPIWKKMAESFLDNPRVLYGVTNEPHDTTDDAVWQSMNKAVEMIRSVESTDVPHHLIAVQGTQNWARKLDYYVGHPIVAGGGVNIIYETHVYDPPSEFASLFEGPSAKLPVIIGEFGPSMMTLANCNELMTRAESLEVPYIGWSFSPECFPEMLKDTGDDCGYGMPLTPTTWGTALKTRMSTPW